MTQPDTSKKRFAVNRKVLAFSMAAGAAVGVFAGRRARPLVEPISEDEQYSSPTMIDWDRVRSIAVSMNKGMALTASERERASELYRSLQLDCIPVVAAYTGISLPSTEERTFAVDRVDWIDANIESFKQMFAPLEILNSQGSSRVALMIGTANRAVLSSEIGLLLAYLGRHVLGQYDLSLLGRERVDTGKLYYVEPNIRSIEAALKLPSEDFRTWLVLHETTHAFEFEGVPWLREYFNGMIEQYFKYLRQDAEELKRGWRSMKSIVERVRDQRGPEVTWLEAAMTPAQRALFARMQAAMCMVEGYSNHVMNAVGRDLLPKFDQISGTFDQRRKERSQIEQLFVRLTGLELKYEQYRLGEEFIDYIARQRGHDVAKRVWDNPASLPDMTEIRDPELWLARVVDARSPV